VGWNALIERAAAHASLRYLRVRLEDLDERGLRELCAALELEVSADDVRTALSQVPADTNTRGRRALDSCVQFEDLPLGPVRAALESTARRYGYADVAAPLARGRLPESLTLF
jgi:hypothetical protein